MFKNPYLFLTSFVILNAQGNATGLPEPWQWHTVFKVQVAGSYQVQDEKSLVSRAQRGDEEAFAQLYEEYFNKIFRYIVIRIGDAMEAEDITQQVFLKALQSIGSFKWKGAPFSAWLYRIAHNQVVDYLRKKGRRTTVPLEEIQVAVEHDPQEEVEKGFDLQQLAAAMQHLTEAQRAVISLRFTSELSTAGAAKVLGKSQGAIKALQHSAIVALRKVLAEG